MAQFHVYRIGENRLVVDLKTGLVDTGTRVVATLLARGPVADLTSHEYEIKGALDMVFSGF